jgi:transposase InsO family protein
LGQFERWRKRSELIGLSSKAKTRLEWLIFYYSDAGKKNATYTAKHFSIAKSKFYFWINRFDERRLVTLEDQSSSPKHLRSWSPDPIILERMISLRKKYIHLSKLKLARKYHDLYGDTISSWQFQRVIMEFNLYPKRKPKKCQGNGAKKQLISYTLRNTAKNLFCLDTKVLWLFGIKYYILVAIAHTGKFCYMRAYKTHSSFAARDFLARLAYLLGADPKVILTDNGSEFLKHFQIACQQKNIKRYFSRVQTPKDNPEVERMIKTYIEEWLNDGKWSPDFYKMNKYITDFLIYYNHERPHEKLNYDTPLAYAETHSLLTKRSSSSTRG